MIEMAFLGFFLILLAVIIIHYAVFFLAAQKIEALTREGVQAAFHDCRAIPIKDRVELLGCLETVADRVESILVNTMGTSVPVLPGDYTILYTSWEYSDPDGTGFQVRKTPGPNNPVTRGTLESGNASKYKNASNFDRSGPSGTRNAVQDKGRLFVCEIFYRHQASRANDKSTTFFNYTFFLPLLNHTIYSASIA